ncbi:MAG: type II secretion system secretin GspD, partial [Nitrospirae bacterium]|nr:type II secretion system secretin GspD [Nitrospirota bacterium]
QPIQSIAEEVNTASETEKFTIEAPATLTEEASSEESADTLTEEASSEESADTLTDEERLYEERPALPPLLPPSNMTPEQVREFFSKPKEEKEEEEYIILNFDNADIKDILTTVSSITKQNFILDQKVGGRITIHSSEKIPVSEVFSVFESVLEVNNLAIIRSGSFLKVVPSPVAVQSPLDIYKDEDVDNLPTSEHPVTQIISVEHVPVKDISAVIKPMLSKAGIVTPIPRLNMLIINDLASSIRYALSILKEIDVDVFESTRMEFFRLKNSDVAGLTRELTDIMGAMNIGREGVSLVPIERLNSLVVFSSSKGLLKTVASWIKKLDDEFTSGQNIFVYNVQNVEAKKIAAVLKTIYTSGGSAAATATAAAAETAGQQVKKDTVKTVKSTQSQSVTESGKVEIDTFDETNSLVILASPGLYNEIRETIKKLDLYPKEVLIEVVIAEVNLDDTDKFGIQWSLLHGLKADGYEYNALAQVSSSGADVPSLITAAPELGDGSSGLSYLIYKPGQLAAMIHALSSRTNLNVLSSPRLLVRDKEEASIEVGSDIPTASSTTVGTNTGTTQNIEYKTVGIKLKIKPSINDEKTVVLNIEQEVSDTLPNVVVGQEGFSYPAFSTRLTKTSVVVPDKHGISIGGIIKERNEKSYQGVPLLSSIPLLGNLFRYTVKIKNKTELIIFLIPHVLTNISEADTATSEFVDQLKNLKKNISTNDMSTDIFKRYKTE